MGALSEFSETTIHYWERRRLIFNAALVLPAWIGWEMSSQFTSAIDDHIPAELSDPLVLRSGFAALILANVCYSLVYLFEVVLAADQPRAWWLRFGRLTLFVVGCVIGMIGAFVTSFQMQTSARGGFVVVEKSGEPVAPGQRP